MPDDESLLDDPTVPDNSLVFRRISAAWYAVDPQSGQRRLTSSAFSDLNGAMSVALGVELAMANRDPREVIANHPGYGLVGLEVGELRKLRLGVVRSPTNGELCHGDVYGKKTKATKRSLCRLAEHGWIVKPDIATTDDG